jgi:hypothetical protein
MLDQSWRKRKALHADSRGSLFAFNPYDIDLLLNSHVAWLDSQKPNFLYSRDAIHSPASFETALRILEDERFYVQSYYLLGWFSIVEVD